jgi:ATP-dependent RNA helicase DDX49/DBP8
MSANEDEVERLVVKKPSHTKLMEFSEMKGMPEWLVKQLEKLGMFRPTPVQAGTIPEAMNGYDVIGSARTGQGKTLCFAVPILASLAEDPGAFRGLILTPTRELALQIAQQFQVLAESIRIRILTIIGGEDLAEQQRQLAGKPHIVIATPGRLAQIILDGASATHVSSLRRLKFFVLDEADRLLSPDYAPQLATIIATLPEKRQTLLFSATMTQNIKQLLSIQSLRKPHIYQDEDIHELDPVLIDGVEKWPTPDTLKMEYIFMPQNVKDCYLLYLVRKFYDEVPGIIIFAPSCQLCEELAAMLNFADPPVGAVRLHRWMKQKDRTQALMQFKSGATKVLVATDLASRGLDIPDVYLVIQFNVPSDPRDYVHRVGRVARRGRQGNSILLIDQFQVKLFLAIEKHLTKPVTEHVADEDEVLRHLNETVTAREMGRLELDDKGFYDRLEMAKSQKQSHFSVNTSRAKPREDHAKPSSSSHERNEKKRPREASAAPTDLKNSKKSKSS